MRKQATIIKDIEKAEKKMIRLSAQLEKRESKSEFRSSEEWCSYRDAADQTTEEYNKKLWNWIDLSQTYDDIKSTEREIEKLESELNDVIEEESKKSVARELLNDNKIDAIEKWLDKWEVAVNIYYSSRPEERVSPEDIKAERNRKSDVFTARITEVVGKVKSAHDLTIGADGNINGFIIGEKKAVEIETIYAGGHNIQRLHTRLIIK